MNLYPSLSGRRSIGDLSDEDITTGSSSPTVGRLYRLECGEVHRIRFPGKIDVVRRIDHHVRGIVERTAS